MYGRKGRLGYMANTLTFTNLILDLRGVAGGDGELACLCGKAGTSHLYDGSAHSSGCVVNGYGCLLNYYSCITNLTSLGLEAAAF